SCSGRRGSTRSQDNRNSRRTTDNMKARNSHCQKRKPPEQEPSAQRQRRRRKPQADQRTFSWIESKPCERAAHPILMAGKFEGIKSCRGPPDLSKSPGPADERRPNAATRM